MVYRISLCLAFAYPLHIPLCLLVSMVQRDTQGSAGQGSHLTVRG